MDRPRRLPACGISARAAREIAAHWVATEGRRTPRFAGAFLHGSIIWLPDDAELPVTSDLDVMLVVDGDTPVQKPGKFRYAGVLLEVSFISLSELSSPEQVLGNAHLAGSMHRPGVLTDPTGHLTGLQRLVERHYSDETWVNRRCADVEAKMWRPCPSEDAPFSEQVNAWLFPTGLTAHLLLVAGLCNPTVRLRYLAARELLSDHGRMAEYAGLLEDLGVSDMTPERALVHLAALERAFADAAAVIRSPFFFAADISAHGYSVAIDGTRELIERGDYREAIFWLAATAVRCQQVFNQDAPHLLLHHASGFMALLADMGIRDRSDLIARRESMLRRLPERREVAREIIASRRDTSGSMV